MITGVIDWSTTADHTNNEILLFIQHHKLAADTAPYLNKVFCIMPSRGLDKKTTEASHKVRAQGFEALKEPKKGRVI